MIAAYRGISPISRVVRFVTWSEYSHVSWVDPDGWEIEAWHKGGVSKVEPFSQHTLGTVVDLYDLVADPPAIAEMRQFLEWQVGKPYDYVGVLHFLTRHPEYARGLGHWFCSEVLVSASRYALAPLLNRVPAYKVSPAMVTYSPLLLSAGSHRVGTRGRRPAEALRGPWRPWPGTLCQATRKP